ncbi:aminoglycoside phosphotransferase family protein [Nocardia asteroides]|uniref:aminoglycoside phosphotransferase family protein n=1 Tax=Nocardia asteroides TaxID=1824 RepID=UPI001E4EC9B6|nr:aminoglycoside phosphotransferase family protein [Nocardia asteroides]UGT61415.1 aminoglycoside phosphotransferase family protein [Nocardia asteroides]
MQPNKPPQYDPVILQEKLRSARIIATGPLNDAYELRDDGRRLFIRVRTIDDLEFGQTFAGERIAYPILPPNVFRPNLFQIGRLPASSNPFAIFEFLPSRDIDWKDRHNLNTLIDMLISIHTIRGEGFGAISDTSLQEKNPQHFFKRLFSSEVDRIDQHSDASAFRDIIRLVRLFNDEHPVLCHGDVHAGNLLLADDRLHLIDWEATRWRIPASDFSKIGHDWLTSDDYRYMVDRYCSLTLRDPEQFRRQITCLKVYSHLRSWNFTNKSGRLVFGVDAATHERLARELLAEMFYIS